MTDNENDDHPPNPPPPQIQNHANQTMSPSPFLSQSPIPSSSAVANAGVAPNTMFAEWLLHQATTPNNSVSVSPASAPRPTSTCTNSEQRTAYVDRTMYDGAPNVDISSRVYNRQAAASAAQLLAQRSSAHLHSLSPRNLTPHAHDTWRSLPFSSASALLSSSSSSVAAAAAVPCSSPLMFSSPIHSRQPFSFFPRPTGGAPGSMLAQPTRANPGFSTRSPLGNSSSSSSSSVLQFPLLLPSRVNAWPSPPSLSPDLLPSLPSVTTTSRSPQLDALALETQIIQKQLELQLMHDQQVNAAAAAAMVGAGSASVDDLAVDSTVQRRKSTRVQSDSRLAIRSALKRTAQGQLKDNPQVGKKAKLSTSDISTGSSNPTTPTSNTATTTNKKKRKIFATTAAPTTGSPQASKKIKSVTSASTTSSAASSSAAAAAALPLEANRRCQGSPDCPFPRAANRNVCRKHAGHRCCRYALAECARSPLVGSHFCRLHGGGVKCGANNCTKIIDVGDGFCSEHNGSKRCQFQAEHCKKSAIGSTQFCKRHGGGKRCQAPDCTKSSQGATSFCIRHGGGKRCGYPDGCDKSAIGRTNLCKRHGGGKRCQKHGCDKSAEGATHMCIRHGGGKRCKRPDCNRCAVAQGLCAAHRTTSKAM